MKPRPTPSPAEMLMKIQDEVANAVAALTGIKAQFIAAGWTPEGAEQMTHELYKQGASK